MAHEHLSVTISPEAMRAINDSTHSTGQTKSKTVNNLILRGAGNEELAELIQIAIEQCFTGLRKKIVADLEEASAPMTKAAKSLNSARKSLSQTRQASLANLVLLSTLAPSIFEMETLAEGSDTTAYQLTQDHISSSEYLDWFWSMAGMLGDGRRGGINSTAAKNVSLSTGMNILGGNRGSAYSLFTQAAMSEVEPPANEEDYYIEDDYEEGYEDNYE